MEKVLAKVNGREIKESDLARFRSSLSPQVAGQFAGEEGRERLLGELINQELFYLEALDEKVEETEEFKAEMQAVKENLLKQFGIKHLLETIRISDEEIRDFYDKNQDMFVEPEKAGAKHILVSTLEEAENLKKRIDEGASFEELAQEHSGCPSGENGGDLGFFSKGQMVPEFEAVAFSTEEGGVSEPVKTQFGYHLVKGMGKQESKQQSFEEVAEEIRQNLTIRKQNQAYLEKVESLKNKFHVEKF